MRFIQKVHRTFSDRLSRSWSKSNTFSSSWKNNRLCFHSRWVYNQFLWLSWSTSCQQSINWQPGLFVTSWVRNELFS